MKNNNQAAVKQIGSRTMRQNRMRNVFAILAIVLTTFMFTTVFSIGFSLGKNINTMMLREQGTRSTISLENPTADQIAQVETCKHLYAAGRKINTGDAQSLNNAETIISLDYDDTTEFEKNFAPAISDQVGSYPVQVDEIMLSKASLDALEVTHPQLDMSITFLVDNTEKTFRLSGWFTDYSFTAGGFQGFVSKAYVEEKQLSVEHDGVLSISAKTGAQSKLLGELDEAVTLNQGQQIVSVYDIQNESGSNAVVLISILSIIGLIILCSGYLLIYNVMYISVTKDIRFYGMLKTIGTSPKQIRKIVTMQAFYLSLIGIPLGVVLGTVTAFAAVPYALKIFSTGNSAMPADISFNPIIYIGTILFGILTVALSCHKPAKLASYVSPVEALKYNGQNVEKIKPKKTTDGGKLYKMAYRNVFREKKRAVLVFASLFMGTMAFLATNTFLGSLKLENYVDYYLPNDYTIYTNCDSDENTEEGKNSSIEAANKLAEQISKLVGVTEVSVNRTIDAEDAEIQFDADLFRPFLENMASDEAQLQEMIQYYQTNTYAAPVISVSVQMMEQYNQQASQKIDIERFEKGEVCLVGYVNSEEQAEAVQGKNITITTENGRRSATFEVGSCPMQSQDHGINIGYWWQQPGAPSCILISENAMAKLTDHPSVDNMIVDCEPKAESYITAQIKELTKTNPSVRHVEIKSEMISDFQSAMAAMNVLTAGISIVLILIGIINFINVMLTGVFARRRELSVMESVGMTRKQVQKMLMLEGVYYGAITIGLILTIGNAIVFAVADFTQKTADYAVFHYPWIIMIGIAAVILLTCILVPAVVYRSLSKESVIERLRNEAV